MGIKLAPDLRFFFQKRATYNSQGPHGGCANTGLKWAISPKSSVTVTWYSQIVLNQNAIFTWYGQCPLNHLKLNRMDPIVLCSQFFGQVDLDGPIFQVGLQQQLATQGAGNHHLGQMEISIVC